MSEIPLAALLLYAILPLVLGAALAAGIFWPRRGLLARWRARRDARLAEDALKHLRAAAELGAAASLLSLAGALRLTQAQAVALVERLGRQGWVIALAGGLRLTPEGERIALEVIRAHRLWERYLADEARMPLTAVHAEAEQREHRRSADSLQALEAALGHPALDPHGDPIPGAGNAPHTPGQPLTEWPLNAPARIVHLEDEPVALFNEIAAAGLRPGQIVRLIEPAPGGLGRLVLAHGAQTHRLSPLAAANIFVAPAEAEMGARPVLTLAGLKRGQRAAVLRFDDSLQGFTRRRLLDLGLTPGASVAAEMGSLFGDPMAYRVRGALIALRREQAERVLIQNVSQIES